MSESPYKSPLTSGWNMKNGWPIAGIAKIVGLVVVVLFLAVMFLPSMRRGVPEAARRTDCMNQIRQLAIALHDYESQHGEYPPAYTVDENGRSLHSWRALILPFLEQQELYDSIDFSKSWNDAVNDTARESSIDVFSCPSTSLELGLTTYLGVVGPRCFFAGSTARQIDEFEKEGMFKIIALVEVGSSQAVHWMSPNDTSAENIMNYGPESKMSHPAGLVMAIGDGSVRCVPRTEMVVIQEMLTMSDDDDHDHSEAAEDIQKRTSEPAN